jgi:hypothetical protein
MAQEASAMGACSFTATVAWDPLDVGVLRRFPSYVILILSVPDHGTSLLQEGVLLGPDSNKCSGYAWVVQ